MHMNLIIQEVEFPCRIESSLVNLITSLHTCSVWGQVEAAGQNLLTDVRVVGAASIWSCLLSS